VTSPREADIDTPSFVFDVCGLWCVSCAGLLEQHLRKIDGIKSVVVDYATNSVACSVEQGSSLDILKSTAQKLGFQLLARGEEVSIVERARIRRLDLIRLVIVLFSSMWSLVFSVSYYVDPATTSFLWLSAAISLPGILIGNAPFALMAVRNLKSGGIGFDALVSLSTIILTATSVANLIDGRGNVYLESVVMGLSVILTSRYLESGFRTRLGNRLFEILGSLGGEVSVSIRDEWSRAPATKVALHSLVKFAAGETVLFDGTIESGGGWLQRAYVTGEGEPVAFGPGHEVVSGSKVVEGELVCRVKKVIGSRWIDGHLLIASGSRIRSSMESYVHHLLRWWIPSVIAASLFAFGRAVIATGFFIDGLQSAAIVLLVGCPCVLVIAEPLTYLWARMKLAQLKVETNSQKFLRLKSGRSVICFDKTGTLTQIEKGSPVWHPVGETDVQFLSSTAASCSWGSQHPIAKEVSATHGITDIVRVGKRARIAGQGVSWIDPSGDVFQLGRPEWVSTDQSLIRFQSVLSRNGVVLGGVTTTSMTLPGVSECLSELRAAGFALTLISGDREPKNGSLSVVHLFDEVQFCATPEDKMGFVKKYHERGFSVIFVGDGINDLQALGEADLAIGIGEKASFLSTVTDVVMDSKVISELPMILRIMRYSRQKCLFGIAAGLLYNIATLLLAVSGALHPLAAVGASVLGLVLIGLVSLFPLPSRVWALKFSRAAVPITRRLTC
jgi:Cu+-exporting ATPase